MDAVEAANTTARLSIRQHCVMQDPSTPHLSPVSLLSLPPRACLVHPLSRHDGPGATHPSISASEKTTVRDGDRTSPAEAPRHPRGKVLVRPQPDRRGKSARQPSSGPDVQEAREARPRLASRGQEPRTIVPSLKAGLDAEGSGCRRVESTYQDSAAVASDSEGPASPLALATMATSSSQAPTELSTGLMGNGTNSAELWFSLSNRAVQGKNEPRVLRSSSSRRHTHPGTGNGRWT